MSRGEGSKLTGHIYSQDKKGLGAVKVSCDGHETITLFDGSYSIEGLSPGEYTVTAHVKGFVGASKKFVVEKGRDVEVDLYLSEAKGTGRVEGYVRDAVTNKPLPGKVVLVLPISNKYSIIDEKGFYSFSDLPEDEYELWTSIIDYADEKVKLSLKEGEVKKHDFYCKTYIEPEPPWG